MDGDSSVDSTPTGLLCPKSNLLQSRLFKTLTFQNLTLKQFRVLLLATLAMNAFFFLSQIARLVYLIVDNSFHTDDNVAPFMVGVIVTFLNCTRLIWLIVSPTPRCALISLSLVLALEVVFVVEVIIYFNQINKDNGVWLLGITLMFMFLQLVSALLLYQYWEFVLFNYDPEDASSNWGSSGTTSRGTITDSMLRGLGIVAPPNNFESRNSCTPTIDSPVIAALRKPIAKEDHLSTNNDGLKQTLSRTSGPNVESYSPDSV